MNLLSILLKTLLGKNTLSALAKKCGLTPAKLNKLIPLALPLLIKYLTSNASNQTGALSLLGALGQHNTAKALPEQIAEADPEDGRNCRVTIREGKFHQVKRMFRCCGKTVVALRRISIGGVSLDDTLGAGGWRRLTEEEKKFLLENCGLKE